MNRELRIGLALSVASILLFFLGFELVLRVLYPGAPQALWVPDRELWATHKPNYATTLHSSAGKTHVITNSLGMRDHELSAKRPDVYRILVVGDSWTFGPGVDLEETYPKVLEKELATLAPGKMFEVLNAGFSGYGTDRELIYLRRHIREIKPDLVILGFFPGNDLSDNLSWNLFELENGVLKEKKNKVGEKFDLRQLSYELKRIFYVYAWLSDRLYIVAQAATGFLGMRQREPVAESFRYEIFLKKSPETVREAWGLTEALIQEVAKTAKNNNADFVLAVIPMDIQFDERRWNATKDKFSLKEDEVDLENPANRIMHICGERELLCIDLLPTLRRANGGEGVLIEGDQHANEVGHRVVAKELAQALVEAGVAN